MNAAADRAHDDHVRAVVRQLNRRFDWLEVLLVVGLLLAGVGIVVGLVLAFHTEPLGRCLDEGCPTHPFMAWGIAVVTISAVLATLVLAAWILGGLVLDALKAQLGRLAAVESDRRT
jgi:hypothetical protein